MELEKIKIIKNFLSLEDANKIINYINTNIKDAIDWKSAGSSPNFLYRPDRWYKRLMDVDDEMSNYIPEMSITRLNEIEQLVKTMIEDTKNKIQEVFNDDRTSYLTALWFAKHLKNDWMDLHSDAGDGYHSQSYYSCILFLNTVNSGGELNFPSMDLSIKPSVGDLVVFLSHGDDMHHEVKVTGEERYTVPMWFTIDPEKEIKFA
jgi:hypothetical protein